MNKTQAIIVAVILILVVGVSSLMYITANSHNTKVDVISNSTLQNGDVIELVLHDEYRNVYPNENIEVQILDDSGWGHTYVVTTDEQGKATVVLTAMENGNYTIHSNYNGTILNKAYHGDAPLTIDDGYDDYYYY